MRVATITRAEWERRGQELFGPDQAQWQFVCPSCGHVQKVEDFRQYKAKGATPESARSSCIGRFDGVHGSVPMLSRKSPCNYTNGGLIGLYPLLVVDEEGRSYKCFDFYEAGARQ